MNNSTTQIEPSIDDLTNASNIGRPVITSTNLSEQFAIEEEVSLDSRQLEQRAKANEHQRSEKWKNHFNWAFIGAFWFLWGCFIIISGVLVYHWVTPEDCHWLSDARLDQLKTLVIAVFASSAISNQQSKLK